MNRVARVVGTLTLYCAVQGCGGGSSSTSQKPASLPPPAVLQSIRVGPRAATLEPNGALRLRTLGLFNDGSASEPSGVVWASLDPAIATVDENGRVEAKAPGTTRISAQSGIVSGSGDVTVVNSPPADDSFTIAVIPDTQFYPGEARGGKRAMFFAQPWFAAASEPSERVKAVIAVGDIVNCGSSLIEWQRARAAYNFLENTAVVYAPVLGNHDYEGGCGDVGTRSTINYDLNFGPARMGQHAWFGATTYPTGSSANFYVTFEHGGRHYLVLALEFFPRDEALAWAKSVLDANLDKQVIVATHAFLNINGNRIREGGLNGPQGFGLSADNDAEEMWTKLIKLYPNIMLVLSGHSEAVAHRTDLGDQGNRIPQILSNYQHTENGGNGYMRLLRVFPQSQTIRVTTYSPFLDQSLTDAANQFEVQYGPVTP
jgi:hypothetical protein